MTQIYQENPLISHISDKWIKVSDSIKLNNWLKIYFLGLFKIKSDCNYTENIFKLILAFEGFVKFYNSIESFCQVLSDVGISDI